MPETSKDVWRFFQENTDPVSGSRPVSPAHAGSQHMDVQRLFFPFYILDTCTLAVGISDQLAFYLQDAPPGGLVIPGTYFCKYPAALHP